MSAVIVALLRTAWGGRVCPGFLLAAVLFAYAPVAPALDLPEPAPFRLLPTSASESVMFDGGSHVIVGAWVSEWRGSTLYLEYWPVEYEISRVKLAQPFSYRAEAYQQQIHFLYVRSDTEEKHREHPTTPPGNGKFDFNIGYQF